MKDLEKAIKEAGANLYSFKNSDGSDEIVDYTISGFLSMHEDLFFDVNLKNIVKAVFFYIENSEDSAYYKNLAKQDLEKIINNTQVLEQSKNYFDVLEDALYRLQQQNKESNE